MAPIGYMKRLLLVVAGILLCVARGVGVAVALVIERGQR